MTSTNKTKDTVADVFASLDAMSLDAIQPRNLAAALADAQGQALAGQILADKAAGAPRPGKPMEAPAKPAKPAQAAKGRALAAAALAGITSGAKRHEANRPGKGKARQLEVPITSQGRLRDVLGELVAGRSRRYVQDVEGWCRASLADGAQRGVLVVWDGLDYSIKLHPQVPPRQLVEVQRAGLAAWLDSAS